LLLVFWIVQLAWVLSFCCGAVGISSTGRDPTLRLVLIYTAVFTLLVSAMVTTTRFRVPFAFWICIAAGIGADRLLARRVTRRSLAFAALAAALLLGASGSRPLFRKFISADFDTPEDFNRAGWRNFKY
jgi:FlaA1/EpsC-like NDP-sugar epimerase